MNVHRLRVFGGSSAGRPVLCSLRAKVSSWPQAVRQKQSRSANMKRDRLLGCHQVLVQSPTRVRLLVGSVQLVHDSTHQRVINKASILNNKEGTHRPLVDQRSYCVSAGVQRLKMVIIIPNEGRDGIGRGLLYAPQEVIAAPIVLFF